MTVHNLVFVIDVDYGDQNSDSHLDVKSHFVKRGILRILLHFAYQYGFEKVRWGYKFFRSKRTGQCAGFKSRGSDFKELQHKTFEDFELEFESKFDGKDKLRPSQQIQKSSQSVQNAVKESLLDFQWDRPDMTSPTKLSLRPRKSNRAGNAPISQEYEPLGSCRNMLFIVSDCPRSRAQLMDYLSLRNQDMPADVSEHIVSRGLQELLVQLQVVLHWIDSSSHVEVMRCADHFGFEKMSDVLVQLCGRVIPVVALLNLCCPVKPQPHSGTGTFAFMSSLGYLLSSEHFYRLVFPVSKADLQWEQGNVLQCCGVTVEPVCRRQRFLQDSVKVSLKGVLQDWDLSSLTEASTESWVIQCSNSSDQGAPAFHRLLMELSAQTLHMFAEVNEDNLVCAAVLTPLSHVTAMLTILHPRMTDNHDHVTTEVIAHSTDETSTDLPEVVSSVLEVGYGIMEEECHEANDCPTNYQVPEWVQRELNPCPLQRDMLDSWFLHSDHSGVSAHLMESMRLLQAVPEQREEEEVSVLQQMLISDLSDLYKKTQGVDNKRSKKRGSQHTPVKQKMKTMSRSLQMLNVARLNVKAQKNQNETEQLVAESKGPDKQCRRRSSERIKAGEANTTNFSSEAELLSFLNSSYDRILAERDSVLTNVQQLLTAVKVFMAESALQASLFVQQHLLKTSRSLRQLYGSAADAESKVRECQLQSLLRLELCRHFSSEQSDSLDGEQMAEEVAEMLRIISLTKDPACLTRFLQEEILPGFLTAIPKVLADVYHSLGTQLPEALLALLPADFFSDESIVKDSVSPSVSAPSLSNHSLALDSGHCLQHLRNRSANKKRSEVLTRHRSMIESSQSLRQIEMPKKTTRASKTKAGVAVERPSAEPQPQKKATQEVTKVRRNLFNQEIVSPSKKAKLPRSQSVSAVEGLKRKRSQGSAEGHKLLTKKVCDTPLHKQVSSRFLHLQKMRRRSMPTEECVVEESPEKPANDLRRSPRIKKFARRHSTTFYSGSQPRSRNLDRAFSASQLHLSDSRNSCINLQTVRSPMRLLFGAAHSPGHPSTSVESHEPRASKTRLSTDSVFESPSKTPMSPGSHWKISYENRTPRTSRTRRTSNTPPSSKMSVSSVPENPVSGSRQDTSGTPRVSPFRPPAIKSPVAETPVKESPLSSPLKSILRTPVKVLAESSSSGLCLHKSPTSRTPKRHVTWSPSPQKRAADSSLPFKVPESPGIVPQSSPRFTRTSNSTFRNSNSRTDIFKTPDKSSMEARLENADMFSQEKTQMLSERIHNKKKPLENEEKSDMSHLGAPSQVIPPIDHRLSSKPNAKSQVKSPSPTYEMVTRSGRTPSKSSNIVSPCKSLFTPDCGTAVSETSDILLKTPTTFVDETKSGKATVSRTRCNLRSQTSVTVASRIKTKSPSGDTCDYGEKHLHSDAQEESQTESSQTSGTDSSLHTESPQFDSSCVSSATTEDDSINIVDAAVVKTEFSSDLKMSISFSRKPSQSTDKLLHHTTSPKSLVPRTNYGFRQTPDRQQREAAARLGYSNDSPRFSTPRGSARSARQKGTRTPNPVTYQVEMEMQTSGLPKLKIKRTGSLNPGDVAPYAGSCSAAQSPVANMKQSQLESPVALLSKHREPGCVSPSICTHVTPAKNTPAKSGSLQTFICQSYTPTQHNAGTVSPMVVAELIPLTPSPQSVGKVTPDNLNSWPRRKKAQVGVVGAKDRILKGEPQLEELLEEAELGVCRLQDNDDTDEPPSNKSAASTSKQPLCAGADASPLSPLNDLNWMEKLAQQGDCGDLQTAEDKMIWTTGHEVKSTAVTPPSAKVRKPVTASGILALTCSPLLFKGKTGSTIKKNTQFKDETVYERMLEFEPPPVSQPVRRSHTGKTNSRKRLLH